MVDFKNVSKIYNHSHIALDGVSFSMKPGEFLSLVGRSGAGKSTLVKLLIAEEKPTKGKITFADIDVQKIKQERIHELRKRIGVVFQDFKLLSQKTAYENIAFAMEVAGLPDSEIRDEVPQILKIVGLESKGNNFPNELSGGEKQRVSIARALAQMPDIIIADEPTGNLDPYNAWEIVKLLLKINEFGTSVMFASHAKEIVDRIGRRVVTLDEGRVISDREMGSYEI